MEQKNLLSQIKIDLNDFHKEKVNQIDNFDYSNVIWKIRQEYGLTKSYILQGIDNLKRYYVVALLDPKNEHAVSDLVDPFWHTHILFTKDYVKFCNDIFNGFIHHLPLNETDLNEIERVGELYTHTIDIYNQIFHEVDKNWWPKLGEDKVLKTVLGPVCLHMLVKDPQINDNALFKAK